MALTKKKVLLALKMEHTKNESVCANWRKMEWFYTPHLVIMKNMELEVIISLNSSVGKNRGH